MSNCLSINFCIFFLSYILDFVCCRTPVFAEEILGEEGVEGEVAKPPEKSFWAKYVSI